MTVPLEISLPFLPMTAIAIRKENYPIISTIPSGTGWEIQFVGEKPADLEAREIHPNLEHAYVHFMENTLNHWNL